MKKIEIDSILLFALVIPFIMGYRLSPGETPYWLFGLIFLGLLFYIILDIIHFLSEKTYFSLKQILLWFIILSVIGSGFISAIIVRHQVHPIYMVHDIVLQQESAIRFLLHGKNPYSTTYFGTPLEEWHYSDKDINPALYHFVMEPFYLLFAIPFYLISTRTIGYFDGRMPLLFLFLILLLIPLFLIKDKRNRLLLTIFLAFNPAMLPYTLEGRSDIFMFSFLVAGLLFLYKKRFSLSGIFIALSFAIKQSAWPILPFYIAYLYFNFKNIRQTLKALIPFIITFSVIIFPFFLWDQKAFIDSTINYLSGASAHSYPISGYGFGKVLNEFGFIKDMKAYYPFTIWQVIIGLPFFIALIKFLHRLPSVNRLVLVYGVFLFVYWYFSRYLNNSHLAYLSMVFITAYFWPENEKQNNKPTK